MDKITITFADRETAEAYKDALVTLLAIINLEKRSPDSTVGKYAEEKKLDVYVHGLFEAISEATFFKRSADIKL
jgi:hypothetical protein